MGDQNGINYAEVRGEETRDRHLLPALPLLAGLVPFTTAAVCYLVRVLLNDNLVDGFVVTPFELIDKQPERGIFAIGLAAGGTLSCAVVMLRYVQIKSSYPLLCARANLASLVIGVVTSLAQASLAAFTPSENLLAHRTLACIYVTSACAWMITQAHVSRVAAAYHSLCAKVMRIGCATLCCACPVAYALGHVFGGAHRRHYFVPMTAEWTVMLLSWLFIGSFVWDFNAVRFKAINKYYGSSSCTQERMIDTHEALEGLESPRNAARMDTAVTEFAM